MSEQFQLQSSERFLMTRMLAMIAHDMKSPIDSNLILLDFFKQENVSASDYAKFFFRLERYLKSSKNILDDLLDWAKIMLRGERAIADSYKQVNLGELTNDIIEYIQPYNHDKQIRLINNIRDEFFCEIHEHLYKFILRNLLMNSIKFSYKNGKTLVNADMDGNSIMISVTDKDTGVKPEKLDNIFSFSGYSESGTQNEPGLGIGLMLCYDSLKYFGGELGAKIINGNDTAFFFTIPLKGTS